MAYDHTPVGGFAFPQPGESVQLWDHFEELGLTIDAWLSGTPRGAIYRDAALSIANGAGVYTNLDADRAVGPAANADIVNNRLNVTRSGLYRVEGSVAWATNATGSRALVLMMHDTSAGTDIQLLSNSRTGASFTSVTEASLGVCPAVAADAGDYFFMKLSQTSGAALNLSAAAGLNYLGFQYLGPQ